jgi:Leucine-rich repeat (LRR) protein
MNRNNTVDSLTYYFAKYIPRTESGKTTLEFEYIPINDVEKRAQVSQFLKKTLSKTIFYFHPFRSYEIGGGIRISNYLSKQNGSSEKLREIMAKQNSNVKKLNLSGLGLGKLPKSIYNFKELEELDLSKNEFQRFRLKPKKLPFLKRIILNDNLLTVNSIRIKKNNQIQMINLSDNDFEAFPKRIEKCTNLKDLHLANNYVTQTDNIRFEKLRQLELLNFYNNQIVELSEGIGKLQNLQILDLYHNQLRFLPKSFIQLEKLETLAISNNNLWEFPESFQNLKKLKTLYAHHNKLSSIDFLPPNVENIDLGFNLLETVPTSFRQASSITDLDISNNRIKSGVETLKELPNLKKVFLALNDFESDLNQYRELQKVILELEKRSVSVK